MKNEFINEIGIKVKVNTFIYFRNRKLDELYGFTDETFSNDKTRLSACEDLLCEYLDGSDFMYSLAKVDGEDYIFFVVEKTNKLNSLVYKINKLIKFLAKNNLNYQNKIAKKDYLDEFFLKGITIK